MDVTLGDSGDATLHVSWCMAVPRFRWATVMTLMTKARIAQADEASEGRNS